MNYRDLEDWMDEDELLAFELDDLYQMTNGHRGLKLSDEWKQTMMSVATRKRDLEHERAKAKSKGQAKA